MVLYINTVPVYYFGFFKRKENKQKEAAIP